MTQTDSPIGLAEDDLLDRILGVDSALVALRCVDPEGLVESLCTIAQRTGKAVYWWRARVGLCRLPGRDEIVPGMVHLADVLRFIDHSPHFGVYFIADRPPEWGPDLLALLQRVARIDPRQQRRLVLLDALADLPAALPACELTWSRPTGARRRLRHGVWVH